MKKIILGLFLAIGLTSCETNSGDDYQSCGNYENIAYTNFPVACNYSIKEMPTTASVAAFKSQEKFDAFFATNSTPCEDNSISSTIDFSKNYLVGIFAGQKPSGGYAIKISSILQNDCEVIIQFYETVPGTNAPVTLATTYPYDFVLIPKTDKPIYFNKVSKPTNTIALGSYNANCNSSNCQEFFGVTDFNIRQYLNVQYNDYELSQYNYQSLTKNGDYTELLKIVPAEIIALKGQTKTYGAPDTSDQGGIYFELQQADVVTKVFFDANDTDDQSTEIIAFKKALTERMASYKITPATFN